MRCPVAILLSLVALPSLLAEPAEKPLGRSLAQRYGPVDQGLVFDTRQGAIGNGRTVRTGNARTKSFAYDQRVAPTKYETRDFSQKKTSWLSKLNFFAKNANTDSKYEIPNATRSADTKTAPVKEARFADKAAPVRDLPGGDRQYLGPESKKLDQAVDPNKPLPGWTGDRMDVMSLEQIRELLNKNK